MKFESQLTIAEEHQPVRNPEGGAYNGNGESQASFSDGASAEFVYGNGISAGEAVENNAFPGLESVEGYSTHLIQLAKVPGGKERSPEGTGILQEAWTASYPTALGGSAPRMIIGESEVEGMERIIGRDDRVQVRNTRGVPFRAICQLLIEAKNGRRYIGTGWLVSPRTLITAGHNIFLHNAGGWAKSVTVTPGLFGTSKPFGSVKTASFRSVIGWVRNRRADSDYGAILLPRNARLNIGNQYFQLAEATASRIRGKYLNISGYPGDKGGRHQWFHARPVRRLSNRRIYYTIDTMGGQSGSPVWIKERNGVWTAVGIHAYGSSTENSATRLIRPILNNTIRWRNEGR